MWRLHSVRAGKRVFLNWELPCDWPARAPRSADVSDLVLRIELMFATWPAFTGFPCLATVHLAYWLAWGGSLVLTIGLVILMWSRWGHSRPLQKCAALSLLVHLILA